MNSQLSKIMKNKFEEDNMKSSITVQLVTLAVINTDGFLEGDSRQVMATVWNEQGEYVDTLDLATLKRLTPNCDVEDIFNPRTFEVYDVSSMTTLYCDENGVWVTNYELNSDCDTVRLEAYLDDNWYYACEKLGGTCNGVYRI